MMLLLPPAGLAWQRLRSRCCQRGLLRRRSTRAVLVVFLHLSSGAAAQPQQRSGIVRQECTCTAALVAVKPFSWIYFFALSLKGFRYVASTGTNLAGTASSTWTKWVKTQILWVQMDVRLRFSRRSRI